MYWFLLVIAGLLEVGFTFSLGKAKSTSGKTAYFWYSLFMICLVVSMTILVTVTQVLPIGNVYAIWTGIGAVGTVLVGIFVFKDSVSFWRIFFIATLIVSIIGLKFVSH